MRKLKLWLGMLVMMGGVLVASPVWAATNEGEFYDICKDASIEKELKEQAGCDKDTAEGEAGERGTAMAQRVINIAIGMTAVLAVVSMVMGGVQMATSLGDPGRVNKGKAAILYGAIALVVATMAAVIVNFVIGAIFG